MCKMAAIGAGIRRDELLGIDEPPEESVTGWGYAYASKGKIIVKKGYGGPWHPTAKGYLDHLPHSSWTILQHRLHTKYFMKTLEDSLHPWVYGRWALCGTMSVSSLIPGLSRDESVPEDNWVDTRYLAKYLGEHGPKKLLKLYKDKQGHFSMGPSFAINNKGQLLIGKTFNRKFYLDEQQRLLSLYGVTAEENFSDTKFGVIESPSGLYSASGKLLGISK